MWLNASQTFGCEAINTPVSVYPLRGSYSTSMRDLRVCERGRAHRMISTPRAARPSFPFSELLAFSCLFSPARCPVNSPYLSSPQVMTAATAVSAARCSAASTYSWPLRGLRRVSNTTYDASACDDIDTLPNISRATLVHAFLWMHPQREPPLACFGITVIELRSILRGVAIWLVALRCWKGKGHHSSCDCGPALGASLLVA